MFNDKQLTWLRIGLFALTAAAATAAGAKTTAYASASSCSADCGCNLGTESCCTLGNGATCGGHTVTPVGTIGGGE